jgi:DNA primase
MSSDLDEIKSRLDIVELISDYVQLKRAGQNHKGLCPFHAEKTPSFMVSPQKQIFHCFGCGAGGDIFSFVMKYEGMEFRDALEFLAKRAGVELRGRGRGEQGQKQALRAIQTEAMDFYRAHLEQSETASRYLSERGVEEDTRRDFSLGYAPHGWQEFYNHLRKKGVKEPLIMQSGLVARGNKGPYDVFRGIIGKGQPKYLNSSETAVFKKSETLYALNKAKDGIREKGNVIVVEGYTDAIMCYQRGISNVVAPLGTALTSGHLRKLGRFTDNLLLVFDGDQAGTAAAKRSLHLVMEHDMRARVLVLPEGEDPDSILKSGDSERMTELISGALTPVEFLLRGQGDRFEASKEAVSMISKTRDHILRAELVMELSDKTGINERDIREELKKQTKSGRMPPVRPERRSYDEEMLLLSATLAVPEKAQDMSERISAADMKDPLIRGLFRKLTEGGLSPDAIVGTEGTEEERALLTRLSINPGFDLGDVDMVVEDCLKKMAQKRVDEKIRTAKKSGDLELLNRLINERQRLMQGA